MLTRLKEDVVRDPKTAPVIKKINGVEASKFVLDTVTTASFNQDADAAYNSMFYSKAFLASESSEGYFANSGRIRYIYQGPNTTFTFDNGTSATIENTASVKANFTGIVDGQSYFDTLCVLTIDGGPREEPAGTISASAQSGQVPGYPAPVLATDDGVVSGYFLEGKGFDDVAVLSPQL